MSDFLLFLHFNVLQSILLVLIVPANGFSVSPSQSVTVGDDVTISCQTDLDNSVKWIFYRTPGQIPDTISYNGIITNGFKRSFSLVSSDSGLIELHIPKTSLSLSGSYECVEDNGIGPGRGRIELTVARKTFSVSSSQVVQVGEQVVLRCVTGLDAPVIWYFSRVGDRRPIVLSSKGRIVNGFDADYKLDSISDDGEYNIIIQQARLNNSGTYECIEDSGLGPGRGKPELTVNTRSSESQEVQVGHLALLTCATGLDTPVDWTFGQNVISSNGTVANAPVYNVMSLGSGKHSLQIRNVEWQHAGVYQCKERVGGKEISSSIALSVGSTSSDMMTMSVVDGRNAVLQCNIHSNRSVVWLYCPEVSEKCDLVYDGKNVVDINDRGYVLNEQYSLHVSNVTLNDEGMYYCLEDEGLGSQRTSIKLIVSIVSIVEVITKTSTVQSSSIKTTASVDHASNILIVSGIVIVIVLYICLLIVVVLFVLKRRTRHQKMCLTTGSLRNLLPVGDPEKAMLKKKHNDELKDPPVIEGQTNELLDSSTGEKTAVIGLAILSDKIYVLHSGQHLVSVYDAVTGELFPEVIDVGADTDSELTALVSCYVNECIYIADRVNKQIIRFEPSNNERAYWPLEVSPSGLSVNTCVESRVIVTSNGTPCSISEYTTKGVLVKTINVPPIVTSLQQAFQLAKNRFIFRCTMPGSDKNKIVYVVNDDKELLFKNDFVDQSASYVTVDRKGQIIVCDESNNCVEVWSLTDFLKYKTTSRFVVSKPCSVFTDDCRGRYVIGNSNGCIFTSHLYDHPSH